jgi:hypothetical protein
VTLAVSGEPARSGIGHLPIVADRPNVVTHGGAAGSDASLDRVAELLTERG